MESGNLARRLRREIAMLLCRTTQKHNVIDSLRWSMMSSDLPSPAEAGFAKAENRFTPRIKSGAGFLGIML